MGAVVAYFAYFGGAVVVPGTLLYRRTAGCSDSLLADIAWGSVTGLLYEMVGWAVFTSLGINRYLWLWPAAAVAAFAAVPSLRPHWRRPAAAGRTSRLLAWATSVSSTLAFAYLAANYYRLNRLPPDGGTYFVDLPWHLGVAFEATRSVPPTIPEVNADGVLSYHWFADAHFAAASLISGVPLPTVLVRTGLFPLVFITVATTACLAVKITRRPAVGAAVALLVVATNAGPEYWTRLHTMRVLFPESPTAMYAVGISGLLMTLLVDLARGRRLSKAQLGLLAVAVVAAPGSKPSVLLVFAPAVGLLLVHDRVRGQPLNRPLLAALALMAVAVLGSLQLFASPGGSTLRPSLLQVQVWRGQTGTRTPMPALLITALAKGYLLALAAAAAMWTRRLRADPAARLLAAVTLVGFVAAWVVSHPGLSQIFFWTTAVPFAEILAVWGLAVALDTTDRDQRRRAATFVAISVAAVLGTMVGVRTATHRNSGVLPGWIALAAAVVLIVTVGRRLQVAPQLRLLVTAVGAIAVTLPVSLVVLPFAPDPDPPEAHLLAQTQAAQWVLNNTPGNDRFATNSHCLHPTRAHCDARSFWLSGFGGRRVLVGGFGVAAPALLRAGADGYPAWRQPYHDQELLRLNDGAFQHPNANLLRRLYDDYDVRWLVADRVAGPVSRQLESIADLRYSNAWIRIYRIEPRLL